MSETAFLLCETNEACIEWWAHDLNDEALFRIIRRAAHKSVIWRCPICGTVFEKQVCYMVGPYGPVCPTCEKTEKSNRDAEREKYQSTPVSSIPELLSAWDDERDPSRVMVIPDFSSGRYEDRVFHFICPNGHHPRIEPYTFLKRGCPFCNSMAKTTPGKGYILDEWPELAAEWGMGNGKYTPDNTRHNSERVIHWSCLVCGHEWSDTPRNRTRSYSACCPSCGKILGSLWWKHPEIAKEWDSKNKLQSCQVRKQIGFRPKWICSRDQNHKWSTNIINRINGSGCPYCEDLSKSRTEIVFFDAAKKVFPTAQSGMTINGSSLSHPWTVDIFITTKGQKVIIEYDGAYWHNRKNIQDTNKSKELLSDGFWVIRLREDGLEPLQIDDPKYFEIIVNPLSNRKDEIMKMVQAHLQQCLADWESD